MRGQSPLDLFSLAVVSVVGLALLAFLSAYTYVPSGPRMRLEPRTLDHLLPLHTGNTWQYRDLVSGSTVPDDPYIITEVPGFTQAHAVAPSGDVPYYMLDFYTDDVHAWSVTYTGVLIGVMTGNETATVLRSVPKNPEAGVAYSVGHDLLCLGTDTVACPAGSFPCYHFRLTTTGSEYWWARGVGLVQKKTSGPDGTAMEHWVLVSYNVYTR